MIIKNRIFADKQRIIRLTKESGWILFGQMTSVIGSLVLVRMMTEYLAPKQYGHMALALSVGVLVCQVSMSGVMPGIMRFYTLAVERGDVPRFTAASRKLMRYGTGATILLGGLIVVGAFLFGYFGWLLALMLAITFAQINSYNSTLSNIQNAARQRAVVAMHGTVDPWVKMAVLAAVMSVTSNTPEAAIFASVTASLLMLTSQVYFFNRLITNTSDRPASHETPWLDEMFRYSKPFMIFNLPTWAQANSDRWALQSFSSTQSVGQYAVLLQLGYTPVSMAVGLITHFIAPILHQRSGDGTDINRNLSVWRISWLISMFGLSVTAIAFLLADRFHEWIFSMLVAESYREVSYLLPWVLLAGGLFATSQVLTLKHMSDINTRLLIAPKVVTSLLAVLLNFLGAWIWGIQGVVVASIIFSSTIFVWMAIISIKMPTLTP